MYRRSRRGQCARVRWSKQSIKRMPGTSGKGEAWEEKQRQELGCLYGSMYMHLELSTFVTRLGLLSFLVLRRKSCLPTTQGSAKASLPWGCCMSGMRSLARPWGHKPCQTTSFHHISDETIRTWSLVFALVTGAIDI